MIAPMMLSKSALANELTPFDPRRASRPAVQVFAGKPFYSPLIEMWGPCHCRRIQLIFDDRAEVRQVT